MESTQSTQETTNTKSSEDYISTDNGDHESNDSVTNPKLSIDIDAAPDGGYGWVIVACVFWLQVHTWGINGVSSLH